MQSKIIIKSELTFKKILKKLKINFIESDRKINFYADDYLIDIDKDAFYFNGLDNEAMSDWFDTMSKKEVSNFLKAYGLFN